MLSLLHAVPFGAFLLIALSVQPALAGDDRGLAREHFTQGVALAKAGDYEQALAQFTRAYALSPHFAVLYNIAQAERALGRADKALDAFERYLQQGADQIAPERRSEVQTEIEALRSELAAREPKAEPAPSPPLEPAPSATAPVPVQPPPLETASPKQPATPPAVAASPGSGQRTFGYALGILGLGLGAATVVHWRWNDGRYEDWKSAYQDYQEDPEPSARGELNEQAQSIDRASGVTLGLGIGAAVSFGTGLVLLLTSVGSAETQTAGARPCWFAGVGVCSRW